MRCLPLLPIVSLILGEILASIAAGASETPATPLSIALDKRQVTLEANGNARDQLTFDLRNPGDIPQAISVPAGLILASRTTDSQVVILRAAAVTVPARSAMEITLPTAALSSRNSTTRQTFTLTSTAEPRLDPLLRVLAELPDAPRTTSQLAVLCLLEDISFPQWRQFAGADPKASPTPAEITQAIDALGLLRATSTTQTFALVKDGDLKARALRNPWSRAKAMTIYGLDLGDGAVPPDLRQLLHLAPGDNCPLCRQRSLMDDPARVP